MRSASTSKAIRIYSETQLVTVWVCDEWWQENVPPAEFDVVSDGESRVLGVLHDVAPVSMHTPLVSDTQFLNQSTAVCRQVPAACALLLYTRLLFPLR